jgi:hypothetical protein
MHIHQISRVARLDTGIQACASSFTRLRWLAEDVIRTFKWIHSAVSHLQSLGLWTPLTRKQSQLHDDTFPEEDTHA